VTGSSSLPEAPRQPVYPTAVARTRARSAAPDVIAAPVAQHRAGLVVLDPFRHRLISQPARQIDQRLHEGAIIGGARDVLHKGAIDLHDIDAELAQIPERSVTGAEIVDRDPAAEVFQPRDEAAQVVDIWIATVSVISTISRSATPGCARISDSIEAHQSGSIVVSGEMLRLSCTFGDSQVQPPEFKHAVIDETYQAKPLATGRYPVPAEPARLAAPCG